MKITIDARELKTSTGRYVERLLHYLQDIDSSNQYTVLLKPADFKSWKPRNKNFVKLRCPYPEFSCSEQLGYLRQLNSLNSDLVHFGMVQQPAFYRGKTVTTMHDLTTTRFRNPAKNLIVFTVKQFVYKLLNKYVARKSSAIITPTEFVKSDVVNYAKVSPDKITVTYEAADVINIPVREIKSIAGKKFIFYVGRAQTHKNLIKLVEAFEIISSASPDLYLVFAGQKSNNYEILEDRVNQTDVRHNIIFTGFVTDPELKWLYQNAEAYVFPSLSEGFGLPGLEAMVHGCPVVSSNATCLPEVYGDAAVYFDPNSAQEMADKISEVITNQKLRKELIEKGHKQAAKYSWRRMAEQTLAVYKQILDQK